MFLKKNKGYFASKKELSATIEHLYELQAIRRAKPGQMSSNMMMVR